MRYFLIIAALFFSVVIAKSQTMDEIFENGKKSFYSDDFDAANKYFMEILNSQGDDYLTHYYKGQIYEIYFDNEKAINELSEALRKNKKFGEAYLKRAVILEKTGDTAGAISDYTSAIKNGEKTADAFFNRASLYQSIGENEKAIKDYTKALDINPSDDISYYNRGKLYMAMAEKDKAISDFEAAIEIDKVWTNELRELIEMLKK
jgi:tetratricopeptide (TPR) repeat protein